MNRADVAARTRRVVIKLGSGLLAGWGTEFDRGLAEDIVTQVCDLLDRRIEVVLVSSGAVALGCERLGIHERPGDIPTIQAAAAIGQGDLLALYQRSLQARGRIGAQILLTHADLADRRRWLNARHALERLLELGAVPIINENDTVAVDELKVGDNDNLASLITNLISADLLIILTDMAGLFTADPRVDPDAVRIATVEDRSVLPDGAVGPPQPGMSVGGMLTKVQAADKAAAFGVPTILASGKEPTTLAQILAGEDVGTMFLASPSRLGSRKAWIAALNPLGTIRIDDGAARALAADGRSLLPSGVVGAEGEFDVGDPVEVRGPDDVPIAQGLTAYNAADARRIMGLQSAEISEALGYHLGDALLHRDDLVLLERA